MNLDNPSKLDVRRERVFLCLAGFFLCSMTLLNVIGITRFIAIGPLALAVGVLPYPLTFLCTDLVSELYGKQRANFMVTVGLVLNFFILAVMWLGQALPAAPTIPPWQTLTLAGEVTLPTGEAISGSYDLFSFVFATTSGAVFASMLAYVAAQYCDVQLFHFFKRLTGGKHLWLRNNFSTLISQGVDSFVVITVTFGATYLSGDTTLKAMLILMGSNYLFKMVVALLDTIPFYALTYWLRGYLGITETEPAQLST